MTNAYFIGYPPKLGPPKLNNLALVLDAILSHSVPQSIYGGLLPIPARVAGD